MIFLNAMGRRFRFGGRGLNNYDEWKAAQRSALEHHIANMNASNPIVVNPGSGDDHADLTTAITNAQSGNRLVKVLGGGSIDITSGTGAAGVYSPKSNGAHVTIYSDPEVGQIVGAKYWELDTGTYFVGLRLANDNGGALRPRITANGLRDMGAIGCKFEGGTYGYKEESGSGNSRRNVSLLWNEFVAPASGSDVFLATSSDVDLSYNWFAGGGQAIRRVLRYGGYGLKCRGNRIVDGFTGISFLTQNGATSGSSPYRFPEWRSPIGDVIDGNYISGCLEESISYDCQGNSVNGHPCIGIGVISSKAGTGASSPRILFACKAGGGVLGNSDTDNTLLFRNPIGKYIQIQTGSLAGKIAMISDITVDSTDVGCIWLTFPGAPTGLQTLRPASSGVGYRQRINSAEMTQEDFSSLAAGARFFVGDISYDNVLSNNVVEMHGYASRNVTGIALWGCGTGLQLTDNQFIHTGMDAGNSSINAIAVSHLSGITRKADCYSSEVGSGESAQMICAHNEIVGNDLGGLTMLLRNAAYGPVANMWAAVSPQLVARNRNCGGGAPSVANWIGNDGTFAGPVSSFANDSASLYGNT